LWRAASPDGLLLMANSLNATGESASVLAPLTPETSATSAASVTPAPLATPATASLPDIRPRGEIDHIRALYVQTPATLTGNLIGMVLMAAIFGPLAAPAKTWGWVGVCATLWLLRLAHYVRFRKTRAAPAEKLRAWRTSWRALVLGQGAMWGAAVWLFWGLGTPYHQLALVLIVYSYCLGSVQLLATQTKVFLLFISLVLTPTILRIATDTAHPWHLELAGILALLFCLTVLLARTYGSALGHAISLKARTDERACAPKWS
jgi:two-component system, sensor histidine kinase